MSDRSNTGRGVAFGLAAAVAVAITYGILAGAIELTLGLIVVALVGGWVVGNAVAYGTWRGAVHDRNPSLQRLAVVLSIAAWVGALSVAYVISQALFPQATTPLSGRLSVAGFFDYVTGLDIVRFIHLIALAAMALIAWRGAR